MDCSSTFTIEALWFVIRNPAWIHFSNMATPLKNYDFSMIVIFFVDENSNFNKQGDLATKS
jgi:hypothetical protein